MDLEVRQAQRTLQRAGVEILTDAVSLEEFPFQYGNLRFIYNKALEQRIESYEDTGKSEDAKCPKGHGQMVREDGRRTVGEALERLNAYYQKNQGK